MASLDRVSGAGIVVDEDGTILDWNDRCRAAFECDLDGLRGESLETLVERGLLDQQGVGEWHTAIDRALKNSTSTTTRVRLHPETDDERQYDVELVPVDGDVNRVECSFQSVRISQRYAETLTALHAATRELMTAEDTNEVLRRTAEAADEILGFPGTAVRKYDPEMGLLRHVAFGAQIEDIESRPPYHIDESPHGRAIKRGETIIDDISEADPYDRDVFSQTMYIPIGEHGLLSVGTVGGTFDETDVQFAEILAENAAAAITVVKTGESLRRERERLDLLKRILSRVLRHNIRNDVNVIRGTADRLDGAVDNELPATIQTRADNIIELSEKAREIERILEAPSGRRAVDPTRIVKDGVAGVEQRFPDADVRLDLTADADVLAHDTLSIAIENLVENACEHGDTDTPVVEVRTRTDGDRVRIDVVDDGPGVPDEEIEVIQSEEETPLSHGSSLGLWLVKLAVDTVDGAVQFEVTDEGTCASLYLDRAPAGDDED